MGRGNEITHGGRLFQILLASPLAGDGPGVGRARRSDETRSDRAKKGTFLGCAPKNSRPWLSIRPNGGLAGQKVSCAEAEERRRARHFATQSIRQKFFAATSPRLRCCNKPKRISAGI